MQKPLISYFRIFILLLSGLAGFQSVAQQVIVDAKLDTNEIKIGDQVDFNIRLQIPENETFLWPLIQDTLPDQIEVVSRSPVDTTILGDGFMNVEQTLKLTVFDSGYYVVRPLQFLYGQELNQSIETEPYLLNVFTVEVDTTGTIKPIKGPIAAPLTLMEVLPWIGLGLVVIALGIFAIYYFTRKSKQQPVVYKRPKPRLPAYRIALDELEKLKNEKLWQRDQIKEYHSRISDILRIYVEDTYNIAAMEMTTWEIVRSFAGAKIEKANLEKLREILELADLVKFAKLKPLPDENEKSMTNAVDFVKRTMPTAENTQNNTEHKIKNAEVTEAH